MGRNEQLRELQEERSGILSLRNTLIFSKWALAVIATMSLAIMVTNFIQADVFYSSYAGIGIVFFSFAALLDAALVRVRMWLVEIDEEIAEMMKQQQQYEDVFHLK